MLHLRRTLAVAWAAIPPLMLSALIHTTDPDIGGIEGLARRWTLVSVVLLAVPLVGAALLCLRFLVESRHGAAVAIAVSAAVLVAGGLALMQSRAGTWVDDLWTVVGGCLLVLVVLALAVLPAAALGWRLRSANDTP